MSKDPSTNVTQPATARLEITTRQLAATLDSRLYAGGLSEVDVHRGCNEAITWGLAAVIVRPDHVATAANAIGDSRIGVATAIGWDPVNDIQPTDAATLVTEGERLAACGATELGVVASPARLAVSEGAKFGEDLAALVEAMSPLGVRVRVIADTDDLTCTQVEDVCRAATDAFAWMVQGGSWRGRRAGLSQMQSMREALPEDVLLKWTEPIRRVETMLLCIAFGVDRFNADVDSLMASAMRAEWHGPLTIPQAGVDF